MGLISPHTHSPPHRLPPQNIVQVTGVALQQAPWLTVSEFMQYGDLRAVMRVGFPICFVLGREEGGLNGSGQTPRLSRLSPPFSPSSLNTLLSRPARKR